MRWPPLPAPPRRASPARHSIPSFQGSWQGLLQILSTPYYISQQKFSLSPSAWVYTASTHIPSLFDFQSCLLSPCAAQNDAPCSRKRNRLASPKPATAYWYGCVARRRPLVVFRQN